MQKLLWAECQKIRRSNIVWITVFATVMVAVIVFVGGRDMYYGSRDIDNAGWYMAMVQGQHCLLFQQSLPSWAVI